MAALCVRERAEARSIVRRGRVRRAVRPRGLQRPVHRPAGVPGMSARRRDRLRGPGRRTCSASRGGAAGTSTCTRCPRCCTTGRSGSRGGRGGAGAAARALRRAGRRVRRLRHLRRAGRRCSTAACRGWRARTATTCSAARGARGARGGAGHVPADRLPRPHVRAHRAARARTRPSSRAARRLLRPLPRVVWLAQRPTPATRAAAERAAARLGAPARGARGRRFRAGRGPGQSDISGGVSERIPGSARVVIVVGAGIVGNCVAYHLARQAGRDIVLLDKGPLPNPGGSTGHASNFIFPIDHSGDDRVHAGQHAPVQGTGGFPRERWNGGGPHGGPMQELKRRMASAKAGGIEAKS